MRELPSVLDEREFAWPGIRFSLGHTASREVGGRAEADNDDLVRTHGIDYGPQLLCSFCRCGDEEGLASSLALKLDYGLQLRHPLRCLQPRPASCQLFRLDRAELDLIDLQHRAQGIQD